jgi:hypothetical protein
LTVTTSANKGLQSILLCLVLLCSPLFAKWVVNQDIFKNLKYYDVNGNVYPLKDRPISFELTGFDYYDHSVYELSYKFEDENMYGLVISPTNGNRLDGTEDLIKTKDGEGSHALVIYTHRMVTGAEQGELGNDPDELIKVMDKNLVLYDVRQQIWIFNLKNSFKIGLSVKDLLELPTMIPDWIEEERAKLVEDYAKIKILPSDTTKESTTCMFDMILQLISEISKKSIEAQIQKYQKLVQAVGGTQEQGDKVREIFGKAETKLKEFVGNKGQNENFYEMGINEMLVKLKSHVDKEAETNLLFDEELNKALIYINKAHYDNIQYVALFLANEQFYQTAMKDFVESVDNLLLHAVLDDLTALLQNLQSINRNPNLVRDLMVPTVINFNTDFKNSFGQFLMDAETETSDFAWMRDVYLTYLMSIQKTPSFDKYKMVKGGFVSIPILLEAYYLQGGFSENEVELGGYVTIPVLNYIRNRQRLI